MFTADVACPSVTDVQAQGKAWFATWNFKSCAITDIGGEPRALFGNVAADVAVALSQWTHLINHMHPASYGAPPGVCGMAQLEVAPTTNRIHIQMVVLFNSNKRLTAIKKEIPHPEINWSVCRDFDDSWEYCCKDESRLAGCEPYSWGVRPVKQQGKRTDLDNAVAVFKAAVGNTQDKLRATAEQCPTAYIKFYKGLEAMGLITEEVYKAPVPKYFTWQAQLDTYMTTNAGHSRWIFWLYDVVGGCGKSTFVRTYIQDRAKRAVQLQGKLDNMAYLYNGERVVFFDVSRTQTEHMDHLYGFAEQLKNGFLTSGKYVCKNKSFPPPHIVFFANQPPAEGKWSADRVRVYELTDGKESKFNEGFFTGAEAAAGGGGGGGAGGAAALLHEPLWGGAGGVLPDGYNPAQPFAHLSMDFLDDGGMDLVGAPAAPAAAAGGPAAAAAPPLFMLDLSCPIDLTED